MKNYRKNQLKSALKLQKEYNFKVSLWDLLEIHSWLLMQAGANPYAAAKASKKTIACYEVTRQYGGPEDGGWWYDCRQLLFTVPFSRRELKIVENDCREESSRYSYYDAIVEYGDGGENETRSRPIYC